MITVPRERESYDPIKQSFSHFSGAQHGIYCALNGLCALQRAQVLLTSWCCKDNACETHDRNVCFLARSSDSGRWDTRRAAEKRCWAISLRSTYSIPLDPLSRWSGFEDNIVSKPSMPNGIIWIWHTELE
ncbi:hypothetical protein TNCV_409781 [Trichonephila clavipes]|nr:hypothetical protein TNCV_409781 [Trichonephila clavipes]